MCLIAIAPKGTEKCSDFFIQGIRESAERNKDGFGYGYKKDKTKAVFYRKGFTNINTMIDEIKDAKLKDEDELIIHLRMRSAGKVSQSNCHPFELDSIPNNLSQCILGRTTLYPLLFHNGTFREFVGIEDDNSDTYNFANQFMRIRGVWNLLKNDKNKFLSTFKEVVSFNKMAFLSREAEMILIGEFTTDQGYIFSNTSYKPMANWSNGWGYGKETIIEKKKLENESLNTKNIKITEDNFKHFKFKSHCDSVSGGSRINKDEYFYVRNFDTKADSVLLEEIENKASYKFLTVSTFKAVFIPIPNPEYSKMYIDYIKLSATIKVTKSSIKKLFNKLVSVIGKKKEYPEFINHKYNEEMYSFNFKAVLLFLSEYPSYIDQNRVASLIDETNKPKVVEINSSCEC